MDNKLFFARIEDAITISSRSQKQKFLGFYSCEEAVLAKRFLENKGYSFKVFGGYASAQRVMFGFFPEWAEDTLFPISALTFTFRKNDILRHRDILGSLMALGINRETVGDILIESGRAVVFVLNDVRDFIKSNVYKIGKVGVLVKEGFDFPLPKVEDLTEKTDTIASERLDCIVSSMASVSRNCATELILSGFVSINSVICEKPTKTIFEGDIITVRGKGKFKILSLSGRTKKDRILLIYNTYK